MKFGVFFIGSVITGDHSRAIEEVLGQTVYAEELGYHSAWFAEHHSAYGMFGSPAVLMAAAAERTKRIRLGVGVSVLTFHNPVAVAEDYAMVDVLSDGRLDFAVGRGNQPLEYHMMMADRDHSKEVFWEAVEVIQKLWSQDGPIDHHGKHFQFQGFQSFPRPVQRPLPLMVAAVTEGTFQECARRGLPVMTASVADLGKLEVLSGKLKPVLDALRAAGTPPAEIRSPLAVNTYIAATPAQAREEFKEALWLQHELAPEDPFSAATLEEIRAKESPDFATYTIAAQQGRKFSTDPDTYMDNAMSRGTLLCTDPAGARDYVRKLQQAGITEFISPTNLGGLSDERVRASMRLFAEEVMPEFTASYQETETTQAA